MNKNIIYVRMCVCYDYDVLNTSENNYTQYRYKCKNNILIPNVN